jgi:hypothetical protein
MYKRKRGGCFYLDFSLKKEMYRKSQETNNITRAKQIEEGITKQLQYHIVQQYDILNILVDLLVMIYYI